MQSTCASLNLEKKKRRMRTLFGTTSVGRSRGLSFSFTHLTTRSAVCSLKAKADAGSQFEPSSLYSLVTRETLRMGRYNILSCESKDVQTGSIKCQLPRSQDTLDNSYPSLNFTGRLSSAPLVVTDVGVMCGDGKRAKEHLQEREY